jgi:site-specific DNA recombinase
MKLKAGALLPWTVPPYGYRSAPDRPRDPAGVQIEPAEGAIVQELFARYLEGNGTLLSLAKYLLQLGLASPRGNRRWSAASLRGLLINLVYTGKLYIGRSRARPARIRRSATHPLGNPSHGQDPTPAEAWTLVGTVPALVSQEDFDRVQAKLALNKKQAARNNKSYRYHCGRWSVADPVNPPALHELPTEDSGITSAAAKPSRCTRSTISVVMRGAFPRSS